MRLTPENLVRQINLLPRDQWFNYVNETTGTEIRIVEVVLPEGPIRIERRVSGNSAVQSMSAEMIRRLVDSMEQGVPVNVDRVLGASYNTRSALEALAARTPDIYWCLPGRIQRFSNRSETVRRGHKHLVWRPDEPHEVNRIVEWHTGNELVISELPAQSITYEALRLPDHSGPQLDPDIQRRHLQMQVLLVLIGDALGMKTWVARNDRSAEYRGAPISSMSSVVSRLEEQTALAAYPEACRKAGFIDAIWFSSDGRRIPAVIEVEHSTGVTPGLTRMRSFLEVAPSLSGMRWVIAAPDDDRDEVVRKASDPQFQSMGVRFLPYSAIEELYWFTERRRILPTDVSESFLDRFMEPVVRGSPL